MELTQREVIGVILWWAEGSKSRRDKRWKNAWTYPVEITNTDPRVIQSFLTFLREDMMIEEKKLKLQIQIHQGDDQNVLEDYWCAMTNIPRERLNRTIVRPAGNKVGKSKGTCKVRCSDKEIYGKLQRLLARLLGDMPGISAVG